MSLGLGMTRFLTCIACALMVSTTGFSKSPVPPGAETLDKGAIEFETGMLWKVGGDTTFNYRIIPFIVSWRTPEWFGFHFRNGSALVVRQKFSAMANFIETGSENRYLGFSGGGVIEWWNPSATWNIFGSAGGGVGWIDAQSAPGGQGQDFTRTGTTSSVSRTRLPRSGPSTRVRCFSICPMAGRRIQIRGWMRWGC